MLESITDLLVAVGTLWLLCITIPLINTIRQDSRDEDIHQDWQDVRTAIRITHNTIIHKIRRNK
jgi:hypothetical protein